MPRKKIIIPWEQIASLCQIGSTIAEITQAVGFDEATLKAHCKKKQKMEWSEFVKKNFTIGKLAIRQAMFNSSIGQAPDGTKSLKPNTTLQVFLAKNWLGYSDNPEPKDLDHDTITAQDLQEYLKEKAEEPLDYEAFAKETFAQLDLPDVNGRNHTTEADVLDLKGKKVTSTDLDNPDTIQGTA